MKKTFSMLLLLCLLLAFAWAMPNQPASAQTAATNVGIFKAYEVAPGASLTLPIEIKGAQALYGIDLKLQFDPGLLKVVDADANTDGVQVALGTFLDPGLLLKNEVDETTGTLWFVMSQVNPSEAKSGNGVLLVVTFEGIKEGVSELKIIELSMSTREGEAIAGTPTDSQVRVKADAASQPAVNLPTQSATGVIIIPTLTATPEPTATPLPSATPEATATVQSQTAIQPQEETEQVFVPVVQQSTEGTAEQAQVVKKGSSTTLIIVGAAGVLLVGGAAVLLKKSKSNYEGEEGEK